MKDHFVVVLDGREPYVVHKQDREESGYPFVQVYGPMDKAEAEDLAFKIDLDAERFEQA